jgi:hydroxyacid-oxoacid transhydrogenase
MRSTLLGRLGSCRNASCLKNRSDSGRARLNRTSTPCIATRTFTTATRSSDTNSSQQEGSGDHLAFDTVCELASSTLRYGAGATSEVGADLAQQFRARQVVLFTDANVRDLACMNVVLESLERHGISHVAVYDQVRVEPNDGSFRHAIQFLQSLEYDAVVALGGGSVIDTAKAANLFACHDDVDLYDFVNAPIGRGLPVPALNSKGKAIKPLIAIPTTAGTGSETTGVAIFDDTATHSKTGIASRQIRPALGIVDPDNTATLPPKVATYSGLDVLCHAMESYTALPYTKRIKPTSPQVRPAYQGSNPIADVWSLFALKTCAANLVAAVHPHDDDNNNNAEARSQMLLASSAAGMGFGNAGVHLCHGMSYPISSQVRDYWGYGKHATDHPLVPHGLSVIVSAPAVFSYTSAADPERHATCARILAGARRQRKHVGSASVESDSYVDVGSWLAGEIRMLCDELNVKVGLRHLGYTEDDIPSLVQGTLPQHRVTKISPRQPIGERELEFLFQQAMNEA